MTEFALGLAALMVWPFAFDALSEPARVAFAIIMTLVGLGQIAFWLGSDPPKQGDDGR